MYLILLPFRRINLTSGLIEPSLLLPSSISCLPNVLKLELPSFPDSMWVTINTSEKKDIGEGGS